MMYSCTMEMSMVASHLIWLFRTRDIRKRAKDAGLSFDESEEGILWQSKGINLEKTLSDLFAKRRSATDSSEVDSDGIEPYIVVPPEHITSKTVPNVMV
jgi:hypothetical protein